LRGWLKRAEAEAGVGEAETLTTSEPVELELVELRKRLKRAEMGRDILEKATAFFAKEKS
jgi:transposase